MEQVSSPSDVLFVLLGAVMVLAMHAGFAFLELGTVRKKNQVNALVKILTDFAVSTIAYFFIGYGVAYGIHFFVGADQLTAQGGFGLVKFFFLLTFAAAIPAIVSGGIAERARFSPQLAAEERELKHFLYDRLYGLPQLKPIREESQRVVAELASAYRADPALLPADWRRSGELDQLRTIADFVAGMTDRFAIARHEEIVGPVNLPPGRF